MPTAIPSMRMIAPSVCSSVGTAWLASALRPVAASTAESARRTGSPAATSAPNATSRMARVLGARHVLVESLADAIVGRRLTELLDDQLRIRDLRARDRVQNRGDLVLGI